MVKYISYQVDRLYRAKSNPIKFWKFAKFLIKRSNCFMVMALNHVFPNWCEEIPYWKVLKIIRTAKEIINKDGDELVYHRVYIPKGDKTRPLGVPTPEWRIILHMWANMLQIYLQDKMLSSQHGFIKGRGTLSAWRHLFNNGIDKAFIFECDLKQFFPSVHVNEITELFFF